MGLHQVWSLPIGLLLTRHKVLEEEMSAADKKRNDSWIPYSRQCIDASDIEAVVSTLKSDFVTQGPRVEYFENALCEFTGAQYAVAVSSGTAALHLAYTGLGIKNGDVGIVPSITFVATANGLRYCGADPVFCDVDSQTGIADQAHLESGIRIADAKGRKVKVLVPVSYSGRMSCLEKIADLAARNNAFVVEDAAHSLGATTDGVKSASCVYSDAATLSFHPVKHICTGEGGAVLTNDKVLARRIRSLRTHGIERLDSMGSAREPWAYSQLHLGFNYRMTDIQASLGLSQLLRIETFVQKRRELAWRYHEVFDSELFSHYFERPEFDDGSSWHLYVIRFRSEEMRRNAYVFLKEMGIGSQIHYIPVYRHPYYGSLDGSQYPGAEAFYSSCLSLPMYSSLKGIEQERVVNAVKLFCESGVE